MVLLSIETEIASKLDYDEVIDKFADTKARKIIYCILVLLLLTIILKYLIICKYQIYLFTIGIIRG